MNTENASTARLADGVYINLPLADYLADPALSGSAFYTLLTDPGAITWESDANPLWAEERPALPQVRGSATHAAVLEGVAAFEQRYAVAPNGVLKTGDELSGWLRRAKAYGAENPNTTGAWAELKVSGSVGELRARIEAARVVIPDTHELYPRFYDEALGGRQAISSGDDAFVRMISHFVRSDPSFKPHLNEGVPELTIVLTINGVRRKCRIDYASAPTILDLKTYGRAPPIDRGLRSHLIRQAFYNGAHLQAVNNWTLALHAGAALRSGDVGINLWADANPAHADRAASVLLGYLKEAPVFRWLWLRMDGAPTALMTPFRQSDGMWQKTADDIDDAISVYREYSETCGAGLWITSAHEQEIADTDWPMSAWGARL